jgi:alkylated DNA repair dioxygenase AlkB
MTRDLFESGERRRLDIPDAEIHYFSHLELGAPPQEILRELIEQTPWRAEVINLWGKQYRQPRLVAWYGDAGARYTYSGLSLEPLPSDSPICALASKRSPARHSTACC